MEITMNEPRPQVVSNYQLRFDSLFNPGRALSFPCDQAGHVDLDALSERSRLNYLYAKATLGREYAYPAVNAVALDPH